MNLKMTYSPRLYLLVGATAGALILLLLAFTPKWRLLPNSSSLLVAIVAGLALLAAVEFIKPFDALLIAVIFLASPLPLVMSLSVSGAIAACLLAIATLGMFLNSQRVLKGKSDRVVPLCWGLFAYSILEAIYGAWRGNDSRFAAGDFFQLAEFTLIYILVQTLVQDRRSLYRMLKWLSVSAIITVVWQLLLFFFGGSGLLPQWEDEFARTIDPNVIFVIIVPLGVYPLLKNLRQRTWAWLLLIPALLNILFSLTRSIWLGCLVAMVILALLAGKAYRGKLIRTVFAVTTGAIVVASLLHFTTGAGTNLLDILEQRVVFAGSQVEQGLEGTDSLAARRFMEIALIGPQTLNSPVLGKGLGATYEIGGFAVIDAVSNEIIDHHYIHNLFLFVAYRMGFVGLALFVWILIRYFRQSFGVWQSLEDGLPRVLVAGFLAANAGQVILSMSWPTVLNHPTGGVIACVMALTFCVGNAQDLQQSGRC
jgi:O-antigen ligase